MRGLSALLAGASLCGLLVLTGCYQRPDLGYGPAGAVKDAPKTEVAFERKRKKVKAPVFPFDSMVSLPQKTNKLNVRSEPGLGEPVVFSLKNGDRLKLLGVKDGWFRLSTPHSDKEGWAFGAYMTLDGLAGFKTMQVGNEGLSLLNGPSAQSKVERQAGAGESLLLVGKKNRDGLVKTIFPDGRVLYARM